MRRRTINGMSRKIESRKSSKSEDSSEHQTLRDFITVQLLSPAGCAANVGPLTAQLYFTSSDNPSISTLPFTSSTSLPPRSYSPPPSQLTRRFGEPSISHYNSPSLPILDSHSSPIKSPVNTSQQAPTQNSTDHPRPQPQ